MKNWSELIGPSAQEDRTLEQASDREGGAQEGGEQGMIGVVEI
jgi:hypothetical protein